MDACREPGSCTLGIFLSREPGGRQLDSIRATSQACTLLCLCRKQRAFWECIFRFQFEER